MTSGQRDHPLPMGVQERNGPAEQRTRPTLRERRKGGLEVAVAADFDDDELLPDGIRRGLHIFSLPVGFGSIRVHEHRDRARPRHKLAQQLQPLRS